ncbi:hypothetical protein Tco_0556646 [Tanacetum coccineum]
MPLNAAFQTDDLDALDSDYVISEITSDSNIISYEQYLKETESAGVQTNTSYDQQNAIIMLVFDVISDQVAKCTTDNLKHKELDASLTAELESYKEQYEHAVVNSTRHGLDTTTIEKPASLEFKRISLPGFRSCTSRSRYWIVSKQTTRYPCEAAYGHKIEN